MPFPRANWWVPGHDEGEERDSLVAFEADRIALRRVFESDRGALLAEQQSGRATSTTDDSV